MATNVFVFLGPPGAGKGSLSQLCVKNFGWKQVAAGNICRQQIAAGTPAGLQMAQAIAAGRLAPEEVVSQMVFDWLDNHTQEKAIILDGFPRTILQAEFLERFLKTRPGQFNLQIIKLRVADEYVLNRMLKRTVCEQPNCQTVYSSSGAGELNSKDGLTCDACGGALIKRQDDSQETIKERLRIYHKHEKDLFNYYDKSGKQIYEINVELSLPEVFDNFAHQFLSSTWSVYNGNIS
jgi:adenylate kinase